MMNEVILYIGSILYMLCYSLEHLALYGTLFLVINMHYAVIIMNCM